jgi:ribosomal protein S18 acetylase RimI-like enzyme
MTVETTQMRRLTSTDAEAFSALRRAVTADNPVPMGLSMEDELTRSIEGFRAQLSAPAPSAMFGAFVGAQLAASAAVSIASMFTAQKHKWILWGVFVHPDFRKQGLGRKLTRQALTHAFDHGARRVNLLVFLPNEAAVDLYRSLGFASFGTEPEVIHLADKWHDGLHMSLLDPAAVTAAP